MRHIVGFLAQITNGAGDLRGGRPGIVGRALHDFDILADPCGTARRRLRASGDFAGCVILLFDDAGRDAARAAWREVSARDGLERSFYEQKDGRWAKIA